ncbi:hypothetical protein GCM10011414_28860 [Croceivirga lutea]|uniref:hypothetical protein n=1 Tax=Croceivirga lutea TaxID=1775167 RepID=UPI00163AF652|nr:hypothetical protein [Croceivirga lutea]GGG57236.1 hypothetical protein GCM10011414_28860 [Croceivirga lutea]
MNQYLWVAGLLCFILGLMHSILGEVLIFRKKKGHKKIAPTIITSDLKERHLRIIWATWHLASFFGWCIGALLLKITMKQTELSADFMQFITITITITMFCSSFLVFIGTKGKHPGWIVLLSIGALTLLEFLNSI